MSNVITRPNGKPYRPRKGIRQVGWSYNHDGDYIPEVAVLGTHNIEKAREFARPYELAYLTGGWQSWMREGFVNGERAWLRDEVRGMACVIFEEVDDKPKKVDCDELQRSGDRSGGNS